MSRDHVIQDTAEQGADGASRRVLVSASQREVFVDTDRQARVGVALFTQRREIRLHLDRVFAAAALPVLVLAPRAFPEPFNVIEQVRGELCPPCCHVSDARASRVFGVGARERVCDVVVFGDASDGAFGDAVAFGDGAGGEFFGGADVFEDGGDRVVWCLGRHEGLPWCLDRPDVPDGHAVLDEFAAGHVQKLRDGDLGRYAFGYEHVVFAGAGRVLLPGAGEFEDVFVGDVGSLHDAPLILGRVM